MATSCGRAPSRIRRAISRATQSASSEPVANASCRTAGGVLAAALRDQPLDDAGPDLEAVRVVEADQPVGGIQDRRARAVVAAQHHDLRAPVPLPELQDVADGGAAELVDRLVVVAHDRHVAVALREQRDQLRLGPVRVLELVHQDVPEATLRRPPGPRATPAGAAGRARPGPRSRWRRWRPAAPGSGRTPGPARPAGAPPPRVPPPRPAPPPCARVALRRHRGRCRRGASAASRDGVGEVGLRRDVLVLARENSVASASRNRVGSPSGRYSSSSNSNRCSRMKTTISGRDRTRTSVGRPSSSANSRTSRSPKAWNVEIAVSV